jgi:NodT family efflux transporter outer membrane factor (OMF) lipoprotein
MSKSILIVLLLVMTSCAVVVKPVQSPAVLPDKFSVTGASKLPDKWWESLHDPALNQLCGQALAGNFSLGSAFNRLEQARAVAKKSGAELVPEVIGTVSAGKSTSDSFASNDFSVGIAASYELDLWGRIRSARNAALLERNSVEEDVFSAAISITAEVASVWYQLTEQRLQLELLNRQIEINKNNVMLIKVRFSGAQASAADVYQQQQLLESVIGNQQTVIATINVLENQLAVLLGNSPGLLAVPTSGQYPVLPPLPDTGLSVSLMQRRPDVRKAYLAVQAADQRVASAIADRFPKLSLAANVEGNSPNLQSVLNNWLATVAGNLVLPLVDGQRRVAEVERNRAVVAEAINNYGAVMLKAVQEVENALVRERQQHLVVDNLARQVELARQSSNIIKLRYLNGVSDFLRVLSAMLSQQSLERNLLQAQQQLIQYRIDLYRALAGKFPFTNIRAAVTIK